MQEQEPWRRLLLRTEETAKRYEEVQQSSNGDGCRLCHETSVIKEYEHWLLMPNAFPYDRYFSTSHMLVSRRHTDGHDLTEAEQAELRHIKTSELGSEYDLIFENLPKQKSIPHHIHFHLVEIRKS